MMLSKTSGFFSQNTPAMNAIIIYDAFVSATTAVARLRRSARDAGCGARWNVIPWRVDLLKFGPTAEEALRDAMDAHLIVLAGCGARSLPWWLQGWLERWATSRREEAALAVFGFGIGVQSSSLEIFTLQNFAKWHGLTLIYDTKRVQADSQAILPEADLEPHSAMVLANGSSAGTP